MSIPKSALEPQDLWGSSWERTRTVDESVIKDITERDPILMKLLYEATMETKRMESKAKRITTWRNGPFMRMSFSSPGCRYKCIMCNYGSGTKLTPDEIPAIMKGPLQEVRDTHVNEVLIGTYGSILDPYEMSLDTLSAICAELRAVPEIATVILETRYDMICDDDLNTLRTELLPDKELIIEMGLESANDDIRARLHKDIDLNGFKRSIDCIHSHGIGVEVNVLLGAPGLSMHDQMLDILDAVITVMWALDVANADGVTIFPVNVKTGTPLHAMYENGKYAPPYGWAGIEILNTLPSDYWPRISFSWYGDPQSIGDGSNVVAPPIMCDHCRDLLVDFYGNWNAHRGDNQYRDMLLQIVNEHTCECRKAMIDNLKARRKSPIMTGWRPMTAEDFNARLELLKKESAENPNQRPAIVIDSVEAASGVTMDKGGD